VVLGDFNTFPFIQHDRNIFFDGEQVEQALKGSNLDDARNLSTFGYFGPLSSITNSRTTLQPFVGPELTEFILDHIQVNEHIEVFTHAIDFTY